MNKAEKSLRWVVNQIPDFKPTTNEEKMLVAIKLYSDAGAEEIKRLEAENAELKARLEKSVELPKPEIYPTFYGMVVKWYTVEEHKELHYSPKEAEVHFAKLKGGENG